MRRLERRDRGRRQRDVRETLHELDPAPGETAGVGPHPAAIEDCLRETQDRVRGEADRQ